MTQRPNLLVIITDQQSAGMMGCAGNSDLRTPAMDRLATEGVRFERAYSTFPLCGPFRAALATGRYPHEIGCLTNGSSLSEDERLRSMGHLLRGAGYRTAFAGKWHVPKIDLVEDGEAFGFECIAGFNDPFVPVACERFLKEPGDRPWLLVASFDNPHNICEHSRDQVLPWGEVEDAPPAAYPNLPANFAPPAFEAQVLASHRRSLPAEQFGYTPERWRWYRHVYARLVEQVDARIGQILDALDRAGQAENTVVIFLSDHGDMAGAHGLAYKSLAYDESARVPFVVRLPGGKAGHVSEALVDAGLDVLPTLLDFAGVDTGAKQGGSLRGRSLRPLLEAGDTMKAATDWRGAVFMESRIDRKDIELRMVRTDQFKYTLMDRGRFREMLFDMEADPGEMVNLAVESRFADVLNEHRKRLHDWCLHTNDRFGSHYSHAAHPVVPGIGFRDAQPRPGAVR